ncbi:MAG TPA: histidine phosphatase family protein [Gaiellaceae bacterium]|nr:histidine phosphatase family protein [Gaiellaceae bacterium]
MERLVLARHGESEYSARGLVNGDAGADPAVALTARGEEEARALGAALATEPLDLCVVSPFPRTRRTAELALAGRDVPLLEEPRLADPRAGAFEGRHLDEYRAWAWATGSGEDAPGGGESRLACVNRYAEAYRDLLARPERTILAVVHALPIAYLVLALRGEPPRPRVDLRIEHAHPNAFAGEELERALAVLDAWRAEPTW